MSKNEFIQGLEAALSGNVPPETVRENLIYYRDYIRTELEKGRTEQDIMDELGDPRLIARTIMDTTSVVFLAKAVRQAATAREADMVRTVPTARMTAILREAVPVDMSIIMI